MSNERKKIGELDFIKIKSFCASLNTISKMKRQTTKWNTHTHTHIYNKSLVPRLYRESL